MAAFPAVPPRDKPTDRPLSAAMHRLYDQWSPLQDPGNDFFTSFRYARITGIGRDAKVSRRDPSSVIKVGDLFYVWYTRRETGSEPLGIENGPDHLPAVDWDLADLWYATSTDGFDWHERGVAVARTAPGEYGDRSATTCDILAANGRYYLYFQTFTGPFRRATGDYCDVSMAWADSPDGPWQRVDRPVVELGAPDEWDSRSIHDPFVIVYRGKYWLYYKGAPLEQEPGRTILRAGGVAIADRPEGPFVKSPLNPVVNSGHETMYWPYRGGVAGLVAMDGPEKDTVQYAPDGLNFEVKAHVQMPPIAGGPFCPDAFADNGDGRGITWGLSHLTDIPDAEQLYPRRHSFLVRFDCDLHRDLNRRGFTVNNLRCDEHTFMQSSFALRDPQREEALALARSAPATVNRAVG